MLCRGRCCSICWYISYSRDQSCRSTWLYSKKLCRARGSSKMSRDPRQTHCDFALLFVDKVFLYRGNAPYRRHDRARHSVPRVIPQWRQCHGRFGTHPQKYPKLLRNQRGHSMHPLWVGSSELNSVSEIRNSVLRNNELAMTYRKKQNRVEDIIVNWWEFSATVGDI
jgi:hypothetical protein